MQHAREDASCYNIIELEAKPVSTTQTIFMSNPICWIEGPVLYLIAIKYHDYIITSTNDFVVRV